MEFSSNIITHDHHAELAVCGELDAFTVGRVRRQVDVAVIDGSADFSVDVSHVTFVDAAGLSVFVRLRNELAERGGVMVFTLVSPRFRQVSGLAGLARAFGLEPAVEGHLAVGR